MNGIVIEHVARKAIGFLRNETMREAQREHVRAVGDEGDKKRDREKCLNGFPLHFGSVALK